MRRLARTVAFNGLEALAFDAPAKLDVARLSMIKFLEDGGALGCDATYFGGGRFLTTQHCLLDLDTRRTRLRTAVPTENLIRADFMMGRLGGASRHAADARDIGKLSLSTASGHS
jgi:hypothetical protein